MRPWEYGQIDAYEWTEALDVQRAWHAGIAEADEEARQFGRAAAS